MRGSDGAGVPLTLAAAWLAACTSVAGLDELSFDASTAIGGSAGGGTAAGAGGTSAGGTSAGGTSAGGTSAGGTSAGGTSGAGGGATMDCLTQYGSLLDYQLCASNAQSCTFYAKSEGLSCDDVCGDLGGECMAGWDGAEPNPCALDAPDTCGASHQTIECQCSLGCGSGPPCNAPQSCISGQCS